MTREMKIGISVGAGLFVLITTLLSHVFYNWLSVLFGAFVSVEVGFWIAKYELTKEVHRDVFHFNRESIFWKIMIPFSKILAGICAAAGLVSGGYLLNFVAEHIYQLYGSIAALVFYGGIICEAAFAWIFVGQMDKKDNLFLSIIGRRMSTFVQSDTLVKWLFVALGMHVMFVFSSVLLVVGFGIAAIGYLSWLVYKTIEALSVLCVKHETHAITFGILIGGLVGSYVAWGNLDATILSLKILLGAAVGSSSSWIMIKYGQWLETFEMIAQAVKVEEK